MPRFTTFLFDLDGTLIDHFAAIHRRHVHTMKQLGLPPPTLAQVRNLLRGILGGARRLRPGGVEKIEKLCGTLLWFGLGHPNITL